MADAWGTFAPSDDLLGYKIRKDLFGGEDAYFKANPNVSGMAAETGDIILNPYAPPNVNRDAVAKNEALRLHLRERKIVPPFDLTDQQTEAFKGTAYSDNPAALKESIAARIYSGDPSAAATPDQIDWVNRSFRKPSSFGSLAGPSWVDQGNEAVAVQTAAEVAAERTRRSVLGSEVPDMFGSLAPRTRGRREEGLITRGLEGLGHIPIGILGAAGTGAAWGSMAPGGDQ